LLLNRMRAEPPKVGSPGLKLQKISILRSQNTKPS
jgi:hypothetical protein